MMKRGVLVGGLVVAATAGCPDEVLVVDPGGAQGVICNPLTSRVEPGARVATKADLLYIESRKAGG